MIVRHSLPILSGWGMTFNECSRFRPVPTEQNPILPDMHGRDSQHPKNVMPDVARIVRALRARNGLLD
jgi:hypothetical protein